MSETEKLQAQVFIARNRISDLETTLAAAERQLEQLHDRLTLSDSERTVLRGRDDGCVRVGELRPIIARLCGLPWPVRAAS